MIVKLYIKNNRIIDVFDNNDFINDLYFHLFGFYTENIASNEKEVTLDLSHIDEVEVIWDEDASYNENFENYYKMYQNYIRSEKIKKLINDDNINENRYKL